MVSMLANLNDLNDEELRSRVIAGDSSAEETLVTRYSRLVRICARPLFLAGGDGEDLTQEGMLGLLSAIRSYDPAIGASFRIYAEICIKNRLLSAVKTAARLKNAPLNNGLSFDEILSNESQTPAALYTDSFRRVPEEQVLARESEKEILNIYSQRLSRFEAQILRLYLTGLSYNEMAESTSRSVKSVDNAVQRIRSKLARYQIPGDIS